MYFPYNFLTNIFFSFIVRVQYIIHIKYMLWPVVGIRLLVNRRIFVVKFLGSQKQVFKYMTGSVLLNPVLFKGQLYSILLGV